MKYELEVIAFDMASCKIATSHGATRIELCANPHEGGTTPSYGMIAEARKTTNLQLFPIIRPRGGDFLYSDQEFNMMIEDVEICKNLGADGVVIGMLNPDGSVDMERCSKLIKAAGKMDVTFHRAFDRTKNPFEALENIINLGCKRILTSGQHPTCDEGVETLASLINQASDRIIVMPGSGIRAKNVVQIAKKTGATSFHSSARKNIPSRMEFSNQLMNESLEHVSLDANELIELKNNLDTHFMLKQ